MYNDAVANTDANSLTTFCFQNAISDRNVFARPFLFQLIVVVSPERYAIVSRFNEAITHSTALTAIYIDSVAVGGVHPVF